MLGGQGILVGIGVLMAIYIIYRVLYTRRLLKNSTKLVEESKAFVRIDPGATQTILVLGDSTAMGTGATPETSTAGRLGSLYPAANVYNYAIIGLNLKGLLEQMDSELLAGFSNKKADLALIQIGANDMVYFTPLSDVEKRLKAVLAKASTISKQVVILHSGLAGTAPIFPLWIEWLWDNRAWAVREIYMREAPKTGAVYIDIITSSSDKNFQKYPHIYYASDMFHPNGEGYGLWFEEIKKVLT